MPRNIFISYKYGDSLVESIPPNSLFGFRSTVRDYVDKLQDVLKARNHINLGEKEGESLAEFADETIRTRLKEKIRGSSITIVLISKGMKDPTKLEKDQWIPWEISYSLRTTTVQGRKSLKNAVLGIVLPDENGSYGWYYIPNPNCGSITHNTNLLFRILSRNMFNKKNSSTRLCNGTIIHEGDYSYIMTVRWDEFIGSTESYIESAIRIRDIENEYEIEINL